VVYERIRLCYTPTPYLHINIPLWVDLYIKYKCLDHLTIITLRSNYEDKLLFSGILNQVGKAVEGCTLVSMYTSSQALLSCDAFGLNYIFEYITSDNTKESCASLRKLTK
jgi:hypothetical protein